MSFRWIAAAALACLLVGCLEAPPDGEPPEDRVDAAAQLGDAGGAGPDAALECPELVPVGGQCSDDCTNDCGNDICVVDCTAGPGCHDSVICAPDFDCEITCDVVGICADAVVDCPANHECKVTCGAADACRDMLVICNGGPCTVTCTGDPQSCDRTIVNCGAGPCTLTCEASQSSPPAVVCGESCACTGC